MEVDLSELIDCNNGLKECTITYRRKMQISLEALQDAGALHCGFNAGQYADATAR